MLNEYVWVYRPTNFGTNDHFFISHLRHVSFLASYTYPRCSGYLTLHIHYLCSVCNEVLRYNKPSGFIERTPSARLYVARWTNAKIIHRVLVVALKKSYNMFTLFTLINITKNVTFENGSLKIQTIEERALQ